MARIRRSTVCVGILLVPATTFMIGFIKFHLDYRIVQAFQPIEFSTNLTLHLPYTGGLRPQLTLNRNLILTSIDKSTKGPEMKKARKPYHVLINSYMNSGSRFTAGMFGFRNDAFYFYEPLWRIGLWDYFHRPNYVCSSIRHNEKCAKKSVDEINIYRERGRIFKALSNTTSYTHPIGMMTDILNKIYNCQLTGLGNLVVQGVQDDYGGPGWQEYKRCIKKRIPKHECLLTQENSCKKATHVVTKVLRLSTESLEELLLQNDRIKVIHLFRDPRAIVNSRIESRGYPTREATSNSRTLCDKMLLDYEGGLKLMEKFPDRFKFVVYEDIKLNVEGAIKKLYEFVGMKFNVAEFQRLNRVRTNDPVNRNPLMSRTRSSDNAKWWRTYLSFNKYKSIEGMCTAVVKMLNLTSFENRQAMHDMTIPSMTLSSIFKV